MIDFAAPETHRFLIDESESIREDKPKTSIVVADELARERVHRWHEEAHEQLDVIRRVGLITWVTSRRAACVWATLSRLKADGITELPL